ncbi:MAG: hypothetical protein KA746_00055 [Pyrinomonadaceae bacterium]|nr:hypothetical protein [Pyrinomonadaceae bacterium]MBP6212553.1 hypothetical protein [Pyrinomonadaceae bacterium]
MSPELDGNSWPVCVRIPFSKFTKLFYSGRFIDPAIFSGGAMVVEQVTFPSLVQFTEHLGSTFAASLDGGESFNIELVETESKISNSIQDSFSLLFKAPVEAQPHQAIYDLEHSVLGNLPLFLVPVRKDSDGLYFEAVFNRLLV